MSMKVNIEERAARAKEFFLSGYNCAQSVFLAYRDFTNLDEQTAAMVASSFGGGMGRLREVCGAVSGMSLVAGFLYPNFDPTNAQSKKDNYAAVHELAESFRKENGFIVCRELLGLAQQKDDPTPSPRTESYYKRRPCAEYVAAAARIIGQKINSMEE